MCFLHPIQLLNMSCDFQEYLWIARNPFIIDCTFYLLYSNYNYCPIYRDSTKLAINTQFIISPTVDPILILSVPPFSIVCCLEMSVVPEEYVPQRPKYQNPLVDR